jgi:hypothetical protein
VPSFCKAWAKQNEDAQERRLGIYAQLLGLGEVGGLFMWIPLWMKDRANERALPKFNYLPDHGVVLLPQIKYAKYNRAARQQGATGIRRLEPKVMAHELGHALSLMHERLARNLMTSGPNSRGLPRGTELSDEQIQAARKVASRGRPYIREEGPEANATSGTPKPQAKQQPALARVLNEQQRASFAEAMRATQAEGQALTRQLAEARKEVQESGDQATEEQRGEVRRLQGELSALRKSVLGRVRPPVTEEQRKQLRRPSSTVQPRS